MNHYKRIPEEVDAWQVGELSDIVKAATASNPITLEGFPVQLLEFLIYGHFKFHCLTDPLDREITLMPYDQRMLSSEYIVKTGGHLLIMSRSEFENSFEEMPEYRSETL